MLLGFIESSQSPIWTSCKEKGKKNFKKCVLGKFTSKSQVDPSR